ncbi:MAG TPA: AAA family ATPase [Candidatus Eisenbacteria bacterium]|nr:AAA family ATPase [Candidatus Eisenbacteria bacterium]
MTPPAELNHHSFANPPRGAPPFVGRAAELEWLRGCLESALAGRPRVALVVGEPGIGKTRLLRELQTHATARGASVCVGRGHEDLAIPFLPIAEALAPRVQSMSASVARLLGGDADVVRRLVHGDVATGAVHDSHRPWQPHDPKLFLAASRAVIELAREEPMVLMLDDVHWVDQASLELFTHLVLGIADVAGRDRLPLLVVASSRPVEPTHRLGRAIARFQRDDVCETLDLEGLGEMDLTRLVQGLGLRRPSHQMIAVVNEATHGNPLFVQEVIDHLRRHGAIREQGGTLTTSASAADVPLPLDVTTAIASRTDALDVETRRLLTLAACIGDRIVPEVLAAVSATPQAVVVERLDGAVAGRLLTTDGRAFQFAHPLIRRAFYATPSPSQRQRMHLTVASALRAHYLPATPDGDLEIAHHLIAAGPAADPIHVVAYARRAGHLAFSRASWTDAARCYAAALDAGGETIPVRERAELHRLAGLAHARDQDAGPCLDHYEKAIAAFTEADDPRGLARSLMGKTRACFTLASVGYGTLIDPGPLTAVAERLADDDPSLCGFVWAELSQVYWTARRAGQAREMAERGLEIGRRLGDDPLAAESHRSAALAASQALDPRGALEHLEQGLVCARRGGDSWIESNLLQRRPLALLWSGRLADADAAAFEAAEITRRLHDWGDNSLAEGALTCLAVARGDFDGAERHAYRAMALLQRSGYPWAGPTALPALACARIARGAFGEAEDALAILGDPGQVFDDPGPAIQFAVFVLRQAVRAWTERPEDLRAELHDRFLPLARPITRDDAADVYAVGMYGALVETAERLAAPELAEPVYDVLVRAAERGVVVSSGWVCLTARVLGAAATMLHRWDEAQAWFETGLAQATTHGMRPELARIHLGLARLLVARGRRADRRRAVDHVGRALPILRELGMTPFEDQARTLAAVLETAAAAPAQLESTEGLNRREHTILFHLARGHDDATIARDLVLRADTLARHLRTLFRKIGVDTRAEAVLYARSLGVVPEPPPARDRPLAVILFTDIAGSAALFDRLGDAAARELVRTHDSIVRDALARTGGVETKHTGDGIMATFASVSLALDCAVLLQRQIAAHNARSPERRLGVRVGINAGEAMLEDHDFFGTAVTAAARICARARPGQILVAEVVRQLASGQAVRFTDKGRVALRGFARRYHLFEVSW